MCAKKKWTISYVKHERFIDKMYQNNVNWKKKMVDNLPFLIFNRNLIQKKISVPQSLYPHFIVSFKNKTFWQLSAVFAEKHGLVLPNWTK